jgi:hypothetical protein
MQTGFDAVFARVAANFYKGADRARAVEGSHGRMAVRGRRMGFSLSQNVRERVHATLVRVAWPLL